MSCSVLCRAHFLGVASKAMRSLLIDRFRARRAEKRGGRRERLALDEDLVFTDNNAEQFLALDEALERLSEMDPELGRIVEMRFFGGLQQREIAAVLGVTTRTVERGWKTASAWLRAQLTAGD